MDSIFQLDQIEEEFFQSYCYSPSPFHYQFQLCTNEELQVHQQQQQLTTMDHSTHKPNSSLKRKSILSSSSSLSFDEFEKRTHNNNHSNEPSKKRKIMHRDVERQRRQEMATLYASLRSLLPLQYVKGKRSISDHTHQTVNYIKHLEKKIEELNKKRDELRKLMCNSSSHHKGAMENSKVAKQDVVTVRPCLVGIEVVISTALEQGIPLSKLLQALIREGLRIINCSSTKIKGRLYHTVESEVIDGGKTTEQITELQQKLISFFGQS